MLPILSTFDEQLVNRQLNLRILKVFFKSLCGENQYYDYLILNINFEQ